MTFKSIAIIKYLEDVDEVYAFVDKDIAMYYRSLIPKHITLNRQKFDPHITIVRKELIKDKTNWNLYHDKKIEFEYFNDISHNATYWWINVECEFFRTIREELGLNKNPPWDNQFHITIGNTKNVP
jgi:hypothetical protein